MTEKELYIMKQIGLRIQHKDPEADVILFGSHARGQAGEESDWDILILINGPKTDRSVEDKYRDEMFQLELELGEPISTLIYSKMDWETKFTSTPLYKNIKKRRTENIMTGSHEDYIQYRIDRSAEIFQDAELLAENKRMSTLTINKSKNAVKVWFSEYMMYVRLKDGREGTVPVEWFPTLRDSDEKGNIVGIEILNASKRFDSPAKLEYEVA